MAHLVKFIVTTLVRIFPNEECNFPYMDVILEEGLYTFTLFFGGGDDQSCKFHDEGYAKMLWNLNPSDRQNIDTSGFSGLISRESAPEDCLVFTNIYLGSIRIRTEDFKTALKELDKKRMEEEIN